MTLGLAFSKVQGMTECADEFGQTELLLHAGNVGGRWFNFGEGLMAVP